MELAKKKCVPCEVGGVPLLREEAKTLLAQVHGWNLSADALHIAKEFIFKDFAGAMAFAVQIGKIAETEGHHPDLQVSWGKVGVILWTHAVGGLSENDFILAAKIDAIGA